MLLRSGVRAFVAAALGNDPSTLECLLLSTEMCSRTSLLIRAKHRSIRGLPRSGPCMGWQPV